MFPVNTQSSLCYKNIYAVFHTFPVCMFLVCTQCFVFFCIYVPCMYAVLHIFLYICSLYVRSVLIYYMCSVPCRYRTEFVHDDVTIILYSSKCSCQSRLDMDLPTVSSVFSHLQFLKLNTYLHRLKSFKIH